MLSGSNPLAAATFPASSAVGSAFRAAFRAVSWTAFAIAATLAFAAWLIVAGPPENAVPGSPPRSAVMGLIDRIQEVPERPDVPGYGRECPSPCSFGEAWSDSTDAPGGHNGCPTRQDVLARDIRGATKKPDDACARSGGILDDPYSGEQIVLGSSYADIHIDHVFPLSAAWDLGAATWEQRQRDRFANDIDANLIAVSGPANVEKGDKLPSEWMPPGPWRCFYAGRMAVAAVTYELAMPTADLEEMRTAAGTCLER
ncbi:HNH endonuclease family protein [Dietzia sp.]|uniref:HNH endonuclease family protein n=1 Tax=Dietzia sp. TaxID=1871616 RepID=UPI002FDA3D1D